MPVQFEEDKPFSTAGLPPEKPKAMIKFLMEEGVAWSPRAAKIELAIIAILLFAGSIALFIYRDILLDRQQKAIQYDATRDPMVINVNPYDI